MEFAEVVRRRRMVRDYDPDRPVPAEVRERLLEHAIRSPSAGFSQGWAFLVLETAEERERLIGPRLNQRNHVARYLVITFFEKVRRCDGINEHFG